VNAHRKAGKKAKASPAFPSEAEILEFVRSFPTEPGKREIARAFHIRGQDRIALKKRLREMTDKGLLSRKGKRIRQAGTLPPVGVLIITGSDDNGELLARPASWDIDRDGPVPQVVLLARRAGGHRTDLQPPAIGDKILAKINATGDAQYPYEASIIRRLATGSARILAVFRKHGEVARVEQVDKKARDDLEVLPGNDAGAKPGELVEIEIVHDRGRGLKSARVVQRLGEVSDQRNISLIATHQHGIPTDFSRETLREVELLEPLSPANRVDLRNVPLVTIDPPDARDHDDAIWASADDDPDNPGGFKIIVAIADVAHYVRPGSALDRDARTRGNSVYFPDRVVPMLPERISNDLCSLKAHEDRPALACTMTFSAKGNKRNHRFERVVIRSHADLSYEQAQAAIDGKPDSVTEPLLDAVVRPLWQAYFCLAKARRRRGPLELDLPERKITLNDKGMIDKITTPERLDAHRLVEEFMIQANVAAAEILESHRSPLVYRVHEAPSPEKVSALTEFLSSLGLSSPKGQVMKPKHFNDLLARVQGKDIQQIVHDVVLRTQTQALYSPANEGHFGLNLRRYTHFTSPIRRYADLLVHRALISALKLGPDGLSDWDIANLTETSELISAAERRAMKAERDTIDRLIAAYMTDHLRSRFTGRISGVTKAGVFISLDDTGADGFVPAATIAGDYFVYDERQHALIGAQSGETFQLADPVEVRLVEVAPVAGGLRFELLSTGKPGKPPTRRRKRPTPSRRRRR
jgi:ribonuclease R